MNKGIQQGKQEGVQEGIEQTLYAIIKNLILISNFTNEEIARIINKPANFVKKVRADLKRKGQL